MAGPNSQDGCASGKRKGRTQNQNVSKQNQNHRKKQQRERQGQRRRRTCSFLEEICVLPPMDSPCWSMFVHRTAACGRDLHWKQERGKEQQRRAVIYLVLPLSCSEVKRSGERRSENDSGKRD